MPVETPAEDAPRVTVNPSNDVRLSRICSDLKRSSGLAGYQVIVTFVLRGPGVYHGAR